MEVSGTNVLSPSFILVDSEVVLSVLHFQIGFLACRSVRHACICVCGSGSHDNLKQRHICKRAEVNHVWVLLMSCRIEDCPKTCSSIHIVYATMPWRFQHQSFPCRTMIDSGLVQSEALGDWMGAPVYGRTVVGSNLYTFGISFVAWYFIVVSSPMILVVYDYVNVVWKRLSFER